VRVSKDFCKDLQKVHKVTLWTFTVLVRVELPPYNRSVCSGFSRSKSKYITLSPENKFHPEK